MPGCVLAANGPPKGERSARHKRIKFRNVAVRRIALKDWKSCRTIFDQTVSPAGCHGRR